ncbi:MULTISPECIES: LPD29 domain-containing protein [Butyricimonas]|uniref:LPD29 domain-containing protein n=1 Tax=Butyricimonas TaxID=574697 RepID=UPI0007FB466A|nr:MULTISPECIES: LPD29 domain-containing protein [Butyricimonas]
MKHFKNISSIAELKKEYRKLALANHPDKGGNTEVMQEINVEFDVLFKIWKNEPSKDDEVETATSETASEYRRNFYTSNGWEGSRYDFSLSTKDIAARVREYVKIQWSGWKFSVRCKYASMCSEIVVYLKGGPVADPLSSEGREKGYYNPQISYMKEEDSRLNDLVNAVMLDVNAYIDSFRYDDSDGMIDYFDTNFYKFVEVRSSDWEEIHKTARVKEAKKGVMVSEDHEEETNTVTVEDIEIIDYSEKAVAVFGNTKAIKEDLKQLGGRFNPALKYDGGKRAGWVFSKSKREALVSLLKGIDMDEKPNEGNDIQLIPSSREERAKMDTVAFTDFISCIQRIAIENGYLHARNHVKEKLKNYYMKFVQLKYIAVMLAEYKKRSSNNTMAA